MKQGLFIFIVLLLVSCGKHEVNRPLNSSVLVQQSYSRESQRVFLEAVINSDIERVELLISQGINIDHEDDLGKTPLLEVVIAKNLIMIDLLIEKGADPLHKDKDGKDSFSYATNDQNIIEVLNKNSLPATYLNERLVLTSKEAKSSDEEQIRKTLTLMKRLIKKGADVNAADAQKNTSLIYAAYNRNLSIANFLVNLPNIDVNRSGARRATALTWAKKNGDQAMIDLLIKFGAN
ncbi:MAG: hypothetical protein Fur0010_24840 [Bdellovibrio sp.]